MLRIFVVGFIGSIMLVLAVMASYELTKDVPETSTATPVESTQMPNATGDVSKEATQDAPAKDQPASKPASKPANDMAKNTKQNSDAAKAPSADAPIKPTAPEGSIVPLDNGTVRTDTKANLRQLPTLPVEVPAQNDAKPQVKPTDTSVPTPNIPPIFPSKNVSDLPKPDIAPSVQTKQGASAQTKKDDAPQKKEIAKDELVVMVTNAPAKKAPHENVITRVRLEVGPRRVALRFIGEKPLAARSFALNDPERFVLDLQGAWALELPRIPKNALLKNLRIGRPEGVTRIVLDLLKKPKQAEVVQINPKTVEIRLY